MQRNEITIEKINSADETTLNAIMDALGSESHEAYEDTAGRLESDGDEVGAELAQACLERWYCINPSQA